jgi:hypothetical protein
MAPRHSAALQQTVYVWKVGGLPGPDPLVEGLIEAEAAGSSKELDLLVFHGPRGPVRSLAADFTPRS